MQKNKLSFKKRYLLLLLPLCLLSYCVYGEVTKEARQKKFLEHPPNVRQIWPSSTNPDGMVLNIPATYIDGSTFIFEPILKQDEEKKREERIKARKEKICDVYTCQELFELLLPKFEPKNLKNLHIFQTKSTEDLEVYKNHYLRLNVNSWRVTPNNNVDRKGYSLPTSSLGLGLQQVFHTKTIFWNEELLNYMIMKPRPDLKLIEVVGLKSNVPGGFYKVLVHKQWDKKYPEDVIEDSQRHKVFFNKDKSGYITTYINCSSETSVVTEEKLEAYSHPKRYHCDHYFEIPELSLDIEAHYSDLYLQEWENIEKNIKYLFNKFEEK